MIIEDAKIKVLRILCENWFKILKINEIMKYSGLGRTWVYKVLKELEQKELIKKVHKTYAINMDNIFCQNLKQTLDLEKLYLLDKLVLNEILSIINSMKFKLGKNLESILLVGSTARFKRVKGSDIDFLVITSKKDLEIESKLEINLIFLTPRGFNEKYLAGDDFIVTSLAYGLILYDTGFISNFLRKPLPFPTNEELQRKKEFIRKLLERVYKLMEINDLENANNELKFIITQVARIKILREGEIPKSRMELPEQIKNKFIKQTLEKTSSKKLTKTQILDVCEKIEDMI